MERILNRSEQAYKNMEAVAGLLEAFSKNDYHYTVEICYLDYGQDWEWTTIIARPMRRDGGMSFQVLNPKEWKEIESAKTPVELAKIVEEIRRDEFFQDK